MIKNARKKLNLTQRELGGLTGISQGYISKLEKKYFICSPTIRQIIHLSIALGLDSLDVAKYFIEKEIKYNTDMSK